MDGDLGVHPGARVVAAVLGDHDVTQDAFLRFGLRQGELQRNENLVRFLAAHVAKPLFARLVHLGGVREPVAHAQFRDDLPPPCSATSDSTMLLPVGAMATCWSTGSTSSTASVVSSLPLSSSSSSFTTAAGSSAPTAGTTMPPANRVLPQVLHRLLCHRTHPRPGGCPASCAFRTSTL